MDFFFQFTPKVSAHSFCHNEDTENTQKQQHQPTVSQMISWPNARILGSSSEEVKLWAEEGLYYYTPI